MTIESVDEKKRGFDCQIVSSGFCVNWKQHPGFGHKEATLGPALPETSSFLTIKQNKNINTRTTRDESTKTQRK